MPDEPKIRISPEEVMIISDALVSAEQVLMRFNGLRIQLDAEPFKVNFAPDFKRLLRAKRLLSKELTSEERKEIVTALDYANIALLLHEAAPILDEGASGPRTVEFGGAGDLVHKALEVLGADRRQR
jgi:hypothetical protein